MTADPPELCLPGYFDAAAPASGSIYGSRGILLSPSSMPAFCPQGFHADLQRRESKRLQGLEKQLSGEELAQVFRTVLQSLILGRPPRDLSEEFNYLRLQGCSNLPDDILSSSIFWDMAESLDHVLVSKERELLQSSPFFSASVDEVTTIGNMKYLCCHVYALDGWRRVPVFMGISKVNIQIFEI